MKLHAGWEDCGVPPQMWADLSLRLKADIARGLRSTRRTSKSLLAWGRRYLPRHFLRQPSGMHLWLAEEFDAMSIQRGTKLNVIGPRGGAKSTLGTLAHVLRAAVEAWEPYIWIVSDTKHQAVCHLENIKLELTENERLAEAYPQATGRGKIWRGNRIQLPNGVTIEAFGTGQRIRGRRHRASRPTLILCDDLQNDSHIASARQRESSQRWFEGTLLKAGTKHTNFVNLATALHRDALALHLDRTPGWTSRVFSAIEKWPDQMSLWQEWEGVYCRPDPDSARAARAFYETHCAAMQAGAQLLWPDEEDLYTLMCMRVEGGHTAFEREKQGRPLNPEECEWPEAYFDERIWFDDWPKNLRVKTVALDPSKGHDARRGDYSAFVMLAVDLEGVLYVEADLARRATPEIVAAGAEICRAFEPQAFAVEINQFQELLASEFAEEFDRQGLVNVQPWSMDNRVNKRVRIRRLGPYLSLRKLRFKTGSPGTRLLVEQLKEFPAGDHDDGPDALEMAIRLAGELLGQSRVGDGLGDRLPAAIRFDSWQAGAGPGTGQLQSHRLLSNRRTFRVAVQGRVATPRAVGFLVSFSETISFEGNGGPASAHLEPLNGPPIKQITRQQTLLRATQSGSSVGYSAYPTPPPPMWPAAALNDRMRVTYRSPRRSGNDGNVAYTHFGVDWSYQYESAAPLFGLPNLWR